MTITFPDMKGKEFTLPALPELSVDKERAITPEWLEAHGFERVTAFSRENWEYFPASFDIEFDEDYDLCYLEKQLDRKQFSIVLTPGHCTSGELHCAFEIYIQDDIGCGFVNIPNQFSEMTEYHFGLLYEAIRRKKLTPVFPQMQELPPAGDDKIPTGATVPSE